MNVLIDYHHSDLAESLHRLLEDRLGAKVYVPSGLGWFESGIWSFGREGFGDQLAQQFLLMGDVDPLQPRRVLRLVTLEEARAMEWDVILATVPDNAPGYARFAHEVGARFAVQVGNVNQWVDTSLDPVILDSTGVWGGIPYSPEWDPEAFAWSDPMSWIYAGKAQHRVSSFVNLFPYLDCYREMEAVRDLLPEWTFSVYGHRGPDGFISPTTAIALLMAESSFGWHDKVTGDGFGFVLHYWASVGRPVIGHGSHYRRQIASDLWEDGVTCIDLDLHPLPEVAEMMRAIASDPGRLAGMSRAIRQRLDERVDWVRDAANVADGLGLR